jgi:H+/Cl- antiporter ClcA
LSAAQSYLNGIDVPGIFLWNTLVVKLLGSVGAVAGGLAVGKEGPFVHAGACLGALISQVRKRQMKGLAYILMWCAFHTAADTLLLGSWGEWRAAWLLLGSVGAVDGGLAVGKEGPFVHTGACLGALISQVRERQSP